MAKHKHYDDANPVEVYPPPVSDSAGERTGNVSPAAQAPGKPPEETQPAPVIPTAGEAVAAADAELIRLRAEVAEFKRDAAATNPPPVGTGSKSFKVGAPGMPERTVKADDEAGAKRAYMAALGVWGLPSEPTVHPE